MPLVFFFCCTLCLLSAAQTAKKHSNNGNMYFHFFSRTSAFTFGAERAVKCKAWFGVSYLTISLAQQKTSFDWAFTYSTRHQ